jgi:DNA-binding GntR family transcriptional regulator
MPEIDRDSPLFPHQQIADWIEGQIQVRGLQPHMPIPSEASIGQEFPEVARTTVRRAVAYLRNKGVIYTVAGRGSYVAPPDEE